MTHKQENHSKVTDDDGAARVHQLPKGAEGPIPLVLLLQTVLTSIQLGSSSISSSLIVRCRVSLYVGRVVRLGLLATS